MNILDSITPTQVLAVILIIYLVICLFSYIFGIRKLILKINTCSSFMPYIKGEISNPGLPKSLIKLTSPKKYSRKKKINIFN